MIILKWYQDKKIISVLVILFAFTVGYFVIINNVSYSFVNNIDSEKAYNNLLSIVEECSNAYATKHKELFKKEDTIYIKVQDLIDEKLLAVKEDGLVVNPIDNSSINAKIIKIKKVDKGYEIEIDK